MTRWIVTKVAVLDIVPERAERVAAGVSAKGVSGLPVIADVLDDDALVEAHVPFREWLRAAAGGKNELIWLINRFESLEIPDKAKADLYDALKLHITWEFSLRASRTGMKQPAGKIFFHNGPLLQRRDVSLATELSGPFVPIQRLTVSVPIASIRRYSRTTLSTPTPAATANTVPAVRFGQM